MWLVIACALSLIVVGRSARDVSYCTGSYSIIVNNETGDDNSSCLQNNTTSTTPCKTLSYVLNHTCLNNTEVVLEGDHWINQTLTVSHVDRLTIRSSGNTNATIYCRLPKTSSDVGSGLLFKSVSDLIILNVIFEKCGTLQYSTIVRNGVNVKYRSAVYIINSTNIHFRECSFTRNVGRGLSIYDINGHVDILKCEFHANEVPKEEKALLVGGGGLSIESTYCSPGYPHCNHNDIMHIRSTSYKINDCVFESNRATDNTNSSIVQLRLFVTGTGYRYSRGGKGGGIDIQIKGHSADTSITIANCRFYNNSARSGGGVHLRVQDYAGETTVTIRSCTFQQNSAQEKSGGALTIAHVVQLNNYSNNITVQDTTFLKNKALWGGAVNIYASKTYTDIILLFINCRWIKNAASIGAAMTIKPSVLHVTPYGKFPATVVHNCSFSNNQVINSAAFLRSSISNNNSHHVVYTGIVDIAAMNISFSEYVAFIGNNGSAIVAKFTQISVLQGTRVEFVKNTASYGGAMSLHGSSSLHLFPYSHIVFDSNHASEYGGAVYATSSHQNDFLFSHKCFITYNSNVHPNEWNTSLTFTNNTAKYGYAIYTDSLLPCAKSLFQETDVNSALKWTPFKYTPDIVQYTIATGPASIIFTLPPEIAPGERVNIHPLSTDDLNQLIPSAYLVIIKSTREAVMTSSYISDDGYLQITGKPDTEFYLTLQTQNTRHVSSTKAGRLGNCPLGFIFENSECVCSASITDKHLVGIPQCDMQSFHTFLKLGFWAGCTDSGEIVTGYCPPGYCDTSNETIPLPRTCEELNVCIPQRRGLLCGECEEGYTVYFHSENYKCGKCEYGAAGLLIYIVAELVPLVLLFVVIMIMKVNMNSGVMQSLLLFEQTITLINHLPSVTPLSQTSKTFISIHSFLLGPLSLEFLLGDLLSFCLWRGATVLDNLAFRYITTLFVILLLSMLVLVIRYNPKVKKVSNKKLIIKVSKKVAKMVTFSETPITHSITTFLILPYTHYTVTSFQILSRLTLTGEGGVTRGSVVQQQGNVDYFGVDHLPYAIPAVLVLLFLSLPPPLLLISYPLLWRIKAKFRCNVETDNDTTLWPICKLIPLIDSFQGVFRDNCRMFAGLLFLWRLIIAATFALSTNLTLLYISIMAAILVIFTIHAVTRPYKRWLYNVIDILMLGNMFIITCLSWIIYNASYDNNISRKTIETAIAFKIILMYLPLVFLAGIMILSLLQRYNVFPENMQFPHSKEGRPSDIKSTSAVKGMSLQQRRNPTADEELFARAAELNSPPQMLVLAVGAAGFELQSKETGQINNTSSKGSEDS